MLKERQASRPSGARGEHPQESKILTGALTLMCNPPKKSPKNKNTPVQVQLDAMVTHHPAVVGRLLIRLPLYREFTNKDRGASLFCAGITFSITFLTLVSFFCKQPEQGCCYPTSKKLLKYVTKGRLLGFSISQPLSGEHLKEGGGNVLHFQRVCRSAAVAKTTLLSL